MNLYIDIGNSCVKWAVSNNEKDVSNAISNRLGKMQSMAYETTILKAQLSLMYQNLGAVKNIIACSVVADASRQAISDCVKDIFDTQIHYIESSHTAHGVTNAYPQFTELGNDRWVAMIAAHHLYQDDVCIIDCGTATTIDVVLKNGQHQGGLISPGFRSQVRALDRYTDIIDSQQNMSKNSPKLLQNNTHFCIEQGCRQMLLSYLRCTVQQLLDNYSDTMQIIITGGEANSLLNELPEHWIFMPDLLLQGLHMIAGFEMNQL